MRVHFTKIGWEEFVDCHGNGEAAKVIELIEAIRRSPFGGPGKPEPLRGTWSGWWSRRLTHEHRLVYAVEGKNADQRVIVAKCVGHYR